VTVSKESDIERSCPMSIKVVCAFRHGGRRGEATKTRKSGFRIIIAETRGACVIAIIWLDQKVGREQDGLKG
jgi:hypothetical protein